MRDKQPEKSRTPGLRRYQVPVGDRVSTPGARVAAAKNTFKKVVPNFGGKEIAIVAVAVCASVFMVGRPVQIERQQWAQEKRLEQSIAAKEKEKALLEAELEKYSSDAYVREQARRRLGLMEKGEKSYRIIDPAMVGEQQVTSAQSQETAVPWYSSLWKSITVPLDQQSVQQITTGQPGSMEE